MQSSEKSNKFLADENVVLKRRLEQSDANNLSLAEDGAKVSGELHALQERNKELQSELAACQSRALHLDEIYNRLLNEFRLDAGTSKVRELKKKLETCEITYATRVQEIFREILRYEKRKFPNYSR